MNRKTAQNLLREFRAKKIIVIGDIMIDEYIWGDVQRISPEAPVPVVEMNDVSVRLGGAANVAHNIAMLGAQPVLIGVVGKDDGAEMLARCTTDGGISTEYLVSDPQRLTTRKTRVIAHQQQVVRIDRENTNPISDEVAEQIIKNIDDQLSTAAAILIQDYNKGLLTNALISRIIEQAHRYNCLVTVDPKFENFFAYKGATLFKPNMREAETMLGMRIRTVQDIQTMGKILLDRLNCRMVLLTQGAAGMALFEGKSSVTHIPTMAQEVYDVSGAGDTVIATTTLALAAGATPVESAILATHAAGIVIGKLGTAPITLTELQNSFTEKEDEGDDN